MDDLRDYLFASAGLACKQDRKITGPKLSDGFEDLDH